MMYRGIGVVVHDQRPQKSASTLAAALLLLAALMLQANGPPILSIHASLLA